MTELLRLPGWLLEGLAMVEYGHGATVSCCTQTSNSAEAAIQVEPLKLMSTVAGPLRHGSRYQSEGPTT